jgi:hypothetical protein
MESKMKILFVMIVIALAMTVEPHQAQAGDNSCVGIVAVGKEWSTIDATVPGQKPYVCRFLTNSKIGQRILSKCPNGSTCEIAMPLPRGGFSIERTMNPPSLVTVKKLDYVEKVQ